MMAATIEAHFLEHRDVAGAVAEALSDEIAGLAHRVRDVVGSGGTLFFCGNGGSAADAQHLAAEYVVRFARARVPASALALTTDTSVLTAAGNDYGFEHVFARQLQALARAGDLLLMHSTSGQSSNLLQAAETARKKGVHTAALLAKGGGQLRDAVDLPLVVPTNSSARAQEMHLLIGHIVCDLVEETLEPDSGPGDGSGHGS